MIIKISGNVLICKRRIKQMMRNEKEVKEKNESNYSKLLKMKFSLLTKRWKITVKMEYV